MASFTAVNQRLMSAIYASPIDYTIASDYIRFLLDVLQVSKEEYETCRITNPSPRVIAVCDKPRKMMYFTITFRPFTPQPGGLEFLPGHDYYFISTSSKDDLHRRIGGRCTSHNMKVVFKVCCGNEAETSSSSVTSRNNCKYLECHIKRSTNTRINLYI